MISADLRGRKALVTGGASGIGLSTAELFARSGATVAINDLARNPRLEEAVQRLRAEGLEVLAAPGDVGDPQGARAMVEEAARAMGGLELPHQQCGHPRYAEHDLPERSGQIHRGLLAAVAFGQPARPFPVHPRRRALAEGGARGGGQHLLLGGLLRRGSSLPYSATKAALINLTKELARALGPKCGSTRSRPAWSNRTGSASSATSRWRRKSRLRPCADAARPPTMRR